MKEEKKLLEDDNVKLENNLKSLRKEIKHRNDIIAQRVYIERHYSVLNNYYSI